MLPLPARTLAHASALVITFGLATMTSSSINAHPFPFDTAKMVGFEILTAEDGAMDATDMVVIKYAARSPFRWLITFAKSGTASPRPAVFGRSRIHQAVQGRPRKAGHRTGVVHAIGERRPWLAG